VFRVTKGFGTKGFLLARDFGVSGRIESYLGVEVEGKGETSKLPELPISQLLQLDTICGIWFNISWLLNFTSVRIRSSCMDILTSQYSTKDSCKMRLS